MILAITQRDIDEGVRHDNAGCPIARSIHRRMPDFRVDVNDAAIYVGPHTYLHSRRSLSFMSDFDLGMKMRPTRLVIYEPDDEE